MTQSATAPAFACPRCGNWLYNGTLVCPSCGGLVYAHQLNQIAAEAQRQEMSNPIAAAQLWQQAISLLPPNSQQYEMVRQRIAMLVGPMPPAAEMPVQNAAQVASVGFPPALITGGTMVLSILAYTMVFSKGRDLLTGLLVSVGFVLLILVHEMGHVVALRWYGLRASPPIFIPFLGALINLRGRPKNALEEAIVGIAGPVAGFLAALIPFLWYCKTGSPIMLEVSFWGFFLNLFNMLPVPPLDGGRATAAVSPWIWLPGLACVPLWMLYDWFAYRQIDFILVLLLMFAWPRVRQTLTGGERHSPYYDIGKRAKGAMGIAYVVVGLTLLVLFWYTNSLMTRSLF